MDLFSAVYLVLIVSAFVIFAGVLAYGDHATRQARRAREAAAAQAVAAHPQHRKAA